MNPEVEKLFSINPYPYRRKFKERELVQEVRPPLVVRLDGVRFSKALGMDTVRDKHVHETLVEACIELMKRYGGDLGFVSSDEISIVFLRGIPYAGRSFKITSIFASLVSAYMSLKLERLLMFDSRIILLNDISEVPEYIAWRMRVTGGNFVALKYHRLTGRKLLPPVREMLGVLETGYEDWMVFGTTIIPEEVELEGINKLTGEKIKYRRRVYRRVSGYYKTMDILAGLLIEHQLRIGMENLING